MSQFLNEVFSGAIQHPNFFNGRILTATDLRDEQEAFLKLTRYLGQAVGTGVVHGLEVTIAPDRDALTISAGLAVNLKGDALALPGEQTVALTLKDRPAPATDSPFVPCDLEGTTVLNGVVATNYYLLTLTSATRFSPGQWADHSGLSDETRRCTSRYEEMGVQFKLVPLASSDLKTLPDLKATIDPNDPKSRSQFAHRCFGTEAWLQQLPAPFETSDRYGLDNVLRDNKILTDCDVPLAVFFYRSQAVQFVDMWPVRRPCLSGGADQGWLQTKPSLVGQRRFIEARAFLLQFQQQLEELRVSGNRNIRARNFFEYLPAAGYLPTNSAAHQGFAVETFFAETQLRQVNLNPAQLRSLFQQSFAFDPIRPDQDEIAIYPVAVASGQAPYLVFLRRELVPSTTAGSGHCTYNLTPDNWQSSLSRIADGVADIHICFQPGNYTLTQPILIRNKGHVKVTGAGLGTRLRSTNAEAALRFENCQSVIIRDLYAENNIAKAPQTPHRLQGTLSFYDCPQVTVEEAALKCISNSQKTVACITVSPRKVGNHRLSDIKSTVRIQRCHLDVGNNQVGMLLINTEYAQVDNNQIAAAQPQNPAAQGIVVGGTVAPDVRILNNTLTNVLQGIHVGVSHHETSRGNPDRIGNLLILGNTIHVAFPNVSRRIIKERHGIFVGNCNSLVIENNFLSLQRFSTTANSNIDGIRLYGFLGRRIIIRQNHLTSGNSQNGFADRGIVVTDLNNPSRTIVQEHNVVE
jgi:hypothetical protein